ncbi:MAG: type II toxin-antitoxin system RelE/ParE family toxin [Pyrinomonadaceae bacterium]|nr:type II toxin-antitoxin system RelE/ParE family toxin [Blastocatellia bacterium]MCW5956268.1 type II toxin-antitoxin system RelE/ParE family toxin [Pyrinomonadaceae bacterium]
MPEYAVQFVRSAQKEFDRLPAKPRTKVTEALTLLSQHPYSELLNVKKLKTSDQLFRVRLADCRIVYEVRDDVLIVVVIKIGHRSDIYKHL